MVHYSWSWISLSKAAAPPHVQGFKPRHLAGSIIDQRQHKLSYKKLDDESLIQGYTTCSGGRIVSWIIYCWLVWCERKTLFPTGNLRSFTSKRTGWKCLGFTFAFHCVPSLHAIGSVLNLFLLLPYLPFYFRERPIHFHFTTSVIRLTRKWKGSGNSGQTKAQERTHPRNEWKATLIQQRFGVATISSSWLQTSKATELMNQGVLVPIGVLGTIRQMLEFSTAL